MRTCYRLSVTCKMPDGGTTTDVKDCSHREYLNHSHMSDVPPDANGTFTYSDEDDDVVVKGFIEQRPDFPVPTVELLPDYPANCNPFHHDTWSMGTDLVRGWMAMHAGHSKDDPLDYIELVNTKTGQRFKINLHPETPTDVDVTDLGNGRYEVHKLGHTPRTLTATSAMDAVDQFFKRNETKGNSK